jgi:hypothetical protein
MGRGLWMAVGSSSALLAFACGGGEAAQTATTTVVETTVTTLPPATSAPTTPVSRATSTTRSTVRATTTSARPATTVATVAATTTTTRALTKAEATQALCREIEASVKLVTGGNTIGGGLRLTRAVSTYEGAADATVVSPARRMLSAALGGDLEASAAATQEAATACSRLGFPISVGVQCVTAPCP